MLSKGYMSIRLFYLEVFAQLFRETNIPGSTASRKTILRRIIDRSITIIAVISSITPKDFPLLETESTQRHRRTGRGGRGGLQPPQILGNSDFLGSERKFGQSQFLKTSPCLFNYFKDLNINLKSA